MNIDEAKKNIEVAKRWLNGSSGELDTAKAIEFGITRTMVEIAEQAIREGTNLRAQLTESERMSADRNDARVSGLREIENLKSDLATLRRVSDERLGRLNEAAENRDKFHADLIDAKKDRESLRVKLETQTKSAVACQEALDRLTREQVERMKAFREGKLANRLVDVAFPHTVGDIDLHAMAVAILSDLAQMPVEFPGHNELMSAYWDTEITHKTPSNNSIRLMTLLQTRLAPLLAARHVNKTESTEQKPTVIAEVMAIHDDLKKTMQERRWYALGYEEKLEPAPNLWERFQSLLKANNMTTGARPLYMADLRLFSKLLDR